MANRAAKSGDAYDMEKKRIARYDKEEELGVPAAIVTWINKVLAGEPQCPGSSCDEIHAYLKDGVILCKYEPSSNKQACAYLTTLTVLLGFLVVLPFMSK